jgi:hypothetical protein
MGFKFNPNVILNVILKIVGQKVFSFAVGTADVIMNRCGKYTKKDGIRMACLSYAWD